MDANGWRRAFPVSRGENATAASLPGRLLAAAQFNPGRFEIVKGLLVLWEGLRLPPLLSIVSVRRRRSRTRRQAGPPFAVAVLKCHQGHQKKQ